MRAIRDSFQDRLTTVLQGIQEKNGRHQGAQWNDSLENLVVVSRFAV